LEYCVARALLDGRITLRDFTDERVNQPEIQGLVSRIKCVESYPMAVMGADSSGLNPQSVTLQMKDGREYKRETPLAAGLPVSPMTESQLAAKIPRLRLPALEHKAVENSLSMLKGLRMLPDIKELMQVISRT